MLAHGLVDKSSTKASFVDVMEEIAKISPSDPAVKAFHQVQADLQRPATTPSDAGFWKTKFGNYRTATSDHFVLVHNASGSSTPPEVAAYLKRLEDHYRGFFYWFAARGQAAPLPQQKLIAVLISKSEEFAAERAVFDNPPLTADGFCARQENLAIFCAVPVDQAYEALSRATRDLWLSGWSREGLLRGEVNKGAPRGADPAEQVKNQMVALLLKALEEESMIASVSHVGTVQLAVATGLLPKHVQEPEWIRYGIGSYAETPKGAYWSGMGAPSWKHLVRWKLWDEAGTLEAQPEEALRSVVTDKYFREMKDTTEKKLALAANDGLVVDLFPGGEKDGRPVPLLRRAEQHAARPGVRRRCAFDLLRCAFDLMDASSPTQVNPGKLSKLANEWYQFIHYTNLEASEAYNDLIEEVKEKMKRRGGGRNRAPRQTQSPPAPAQPPK